MTAERGPPGCRAAFVRTACARALFICLCAATWPTGAVLGAAPSGYASLAEPKALAQIADVPAITGMAGSAPNEVTAALSALADCEARRQQDQGPCELVRLNDEPITTARQMRASVPAGPRPLFLWRFRSKTASVYLAGSVHVLKAALYPLAPHYERAFAASGALVLEVDLARHTAADIQQLLREHAFLEEGRDLGALLGAELYQRTRSRLDGYGLPADLRETAKPAFLMNQLVVGRLLALGYEQRFGLEQHFLNQRGARPVLELETVESQFSLLFDQPLDLQVALLRDALDQEPETESIVASMIIAWLAGDDVAFMRLFEQQAGDSEAVRRFNRQLLNDRNQQMAAGIRELLAGTGSYFVLIGTAHYIGEAGIISLLGQHGVHGRRITSDTPLDSIN